MKHRHGNRILGRTAQHRLSLLQGLAGELLVHHAITTTEAKAKELRRHLEPLITEAKKELTLARRRRLLAQLRSAEELSLLTTVAATNATRPGGYLRLTKLPRTRHDAAAMARVEFVA